MKRKIDFWDSLMAALAVTIILFSMVWTVVSGMMLRANYFLDRQLFEKFSFCGCIAWIVLTLIFNGKYKKKINKWLGN
jgi:hypothetical protein